MWLYQHQYLMQRHLMDAFRLILWILEHILSKRCSVWGWVAREDFIPNGTIKVGAAVFLGSDLLICTPTPWASVWLRFFCSPQNPLLFISPYKKSFDLWVVSLPGLESKGWRGSKSNSPAAVPPARNSSQSSQTQTPISIWIVPHCEPRFAGP